MSLLDKIFSNNKSSEIYYPEHKKIEPVEVERIELTEKQAVEQGWSFRKKKRRIRITNYHGTEKDIIIPSKIGDMIVNEIGSNAFRSKEIDSVQIPGTIHKVSDSAFAFSKIKSVTFAEGTKKIMEKAFYCCRELYEVHLPDTLEIIGKSAFEHCTSLDYIIFPCRLRTIGENAFYASGLLGFSMQTATRFCFTDGSIFERTPIQNNYKLLVTYEYNAYENINILLVGAKAFVKFRKGSKVHLMKNAVNCGCTLDFSECAEILFEDDAYKDKRDIAGCVNWSALCDAIVPQKFKHLYFPNYVDVRYPDGSKYNGYMEIVKNNVKDMHIVIHSDTIHPWSVNTKAEKMSIEYKKYVKIRKNAFDEKKLKSITLGFLYSGEEIFSRYCDNLQEVQYDEYVKIGDIRHITRFIPPAELVGRNIHQKLLTAFTDVTKYSNKNYINSPDNGFRSSYFFDSVIISQIFLKGYFEYSNYWDNRKKIQKLNQRSKIFIAIDVLRSSVTHHDIDTQIYKDYLRTHERYAKIICDRVKNKYPEYSEYLDTLTYE